MYERLAIALVLMALINRVKGLFFISEIMPITIQIPKATKRKKIAYEHIVNTCTDICKNVSPIKLHGKTELPQISETILVSALKSLSMNVKRVAQL